MKSLRILFPVSLLAVASAFLVAKPVSGQTATANTDPVGYTTTALLANSDTLVSIPFTQPAAFVGAISGVSGSTITVASSPGWTTSQFVYSKGVQSNTYYAVVGPNVSSLTGTVTVANGGTTVTGVGTTFTTQVAVGDELLVNGLAYNVSAIASPTSLTLSRGYTGTSGAGLSATVDHSPKEGCYYTVTANGSNTLTVNLNGDSLAAVTASTSVSLIPYWTLGTLFPTAAAGTSFIDSVTPKSPQTQILLPDLTSTGTNLAAAFIYFHYNGAWRLAGSSDLTVAYDDTVLPPANYFTVRNATTASTLTPTGAVYMNRLSIPLDTQASVQQDNAVGVTRPTSIALNDLGLISSGSFAATTSLKNPTDLLLAYDNTVAGYNKAASAVYLYYNGAWRLSGGDPTVDYGSTSFLYGSAFTVRKAANNTGLTSFWQNTRTY